MEAAVGRREFPISKVWLQAVVLVVVCGFFVLAAARRTIEDFRTNRHDGKTHTLTFSAAEASAFRRLVPYYSGYFSDPKSEHGLKPDAITDRSALRDLTAFFAWTAWAAAAKRPGHSATRPTSPPDAGRASRGV